MMKMFVMMVAATMSMPMPTAILIDPWDSGVDVDDGLYDVGYDNKWNDTTMPVMIMRATITIIKVIIITMVIVIIMVTQHHHRHRHVRLQYHYHHHNGDVVQYRQYDGNDYAVHLDETTTVLLQLLHRI